MQFICALVGAALILPAVHRYKGARSSDPDNSVLSTTNVSFSLSRQSPLVRVRALSFELVSTIGRLHLSGAPATAAHRPRSVSSKFDVTATAGKLGRRRFGCRPTWFFDYRRNERFGSTGPTGPTGPTRPTKPERTRPTKPERTRPTKPERTRPTKQERTRPTKPE